MNASRPKRNTIQLAWKP